MTSSPEKLALVFPGQGAHDLGMLERARELPNFAARYTVVADALGSSPLDELARGNIAYLNQNRVAALLTILVSSLSLDRFLERHAAPADFLAGYSVGQWTALHAAGVLPFERLVSVVAARSAMMDACFAGRRGAMLAVIGLSSEPVEELARSLRSEGHELWISNYNCVGQITIAGTESAVTAVETMLASLAPRKLARVPVSGAWHTPLLADAHRAFAEHLRGVELGPAHVPVIDNVTGHFLPDDAAALRAQLAKHLDHPVQWDKGMRQLVGSGVGRFVEVGYGNVLTQFGLFIDRSVEHQSFHVG